MQKDKEKILRHILGMIHERFPDSGTAFDTINPNFEYIIYHIRSPKRGGKIWFRDAMVVIARGEDFYSESSWEIPLADPDCFDKIVSEIAGVA